MKEIYKAMFKKKSPLSPNRNSFCFIELFVDEGTIMEVLEKMGRDATPKGFVFVGVTKKFQVFRGKRV